MEIGCGLGIPEEELAGVIINPKSKQPISPVTLRKHFRDELDRGLTRTKMRVGAALVRTALGVEPTQHHEGYPGNVTAQIFYLKTRAGWKEPQTPPLIPGDDIPQPEAPIEEERSRLERARRIAFAMEDAARKMAGGAYPRLQLKDKTREKTKA